MASPARTLEPEELLAQASWVRGIVQKLVLDEAFAEDVVQDTWVAALERSTAPGEHGGLRAWLAAVARNLARRKRRREALRAAVEQAAARAERVEGGSELGLEELERMQLQRALVDAVLALEEPLRSAVILRHLDGLSAAEIARRQGCTPELARQRVSRGLAHLRARLTHLPGRHAEGCLALVPLLGKNWSGGLLAGGIAVGSKLTLGIAGAALAALGLWMTLASGAERGGGGDSAASVPAVRSQALQLSEDEIDSAPSAPLFPPSGSPVLESAARIQADPHPNVAHGAARTLRGLVTDSHGRPLANATLRGVRPEQPFEFQSGDDGSVVGELPAELQSATQVQASCEGYLARTVELDLALPFTLELQALPALAGRLLDPEGSPASPPGYVKALVLDAVTQEKHALEAGLAEDGSYHVAGLPLGRLVSVEGRARGFGATELSQDLALEPDSTTKLDLSLAPGAVVTGTALDARTHEPVPHASVWLETFGPEPGSVHPVTVADEAGRFRLTGANESVQVQDGSRWVFFQLVATAPDYAAAPTRMYGAQANDEHAYEFELLLEPAGCSLRVRALLADGRPARGATVWAIDAQGNGFFESADGEGVHLFESLPAGPFGLWLALEERSQVQVVGLVGSKFVSFGHGLNALRVDLELAPGEARSAEFVLHPPGKASLAGRVLDIQGRGVADFAVRCHLNFQLNNLMLAGGWDETRTDAEGRFRFEGQQPGKYEIWASGEGTSLACAQPTHAYVDLEEGQAGVVEDLLVGPCLTIEGRVAPGALDLDALELVARNPLTGARHAVTRPAADGSFRFEPLVAREYEVVLFHDGALLDRALASALSSAGLFLRAP